jgi:AcrR family transcriptional regulator
MGRPRQHDEHTREALRAAAERLFEERGAEGLSVRALAHEVGTTTQAIYTLFGSRDGLVVDSLACRAFELLAAGLDDLPVTVDPATDLVEAGATVFRQFVIDHPALFRIAFQRAVPEFTAGPELTEARAAALERLRQRVEALGDAGELGDTTVDEAVVAFNALCEGLGNAQLRGRVLAILPEGREEAVWRVALERLVRGFGATCKAR